MCAIKALVPSARYAIYALKIGQDISKYQIPDSCLIPCCVIDPKSINGPVIEQLQVSLNM
jgi:hypothetical protein